MSGRVLQLSAKWAESIRRRDRTGSAATHLSLRSARGFTLLELMIVMFIIIILVTVALPQYQHYVLRARETVLHDDLTKMRSLIDQYAADKGKLPQSLDDLVAAGYMREVPVDPVTGEKNWQVVTGPDPNSSKGEEGMTDIKSGSQENSSEGSPYADW